jgi:hypothetical protein
MPRYAHWQTDVQRRAEVNAVVEMLQKGVSTSPFCQRPVAA